MTTRLFLSLFACLLIPLQCCAETKIVLLGTGTPNPDPTRSGPATAIVVNGEAYLIDCGPGIVRRATAARAQGVDALAARNLKHVFITHLHSDHTLGLPDLIFTPWVVGRTAPLEAYGPKGLQAMTNHLMEAWKEDIAIRVDGLEHGNKTGYKVNVHEIKPGVIYKDKNVTVTAFRVKHGSWKEAFGYRFDTPDKSIVISGDTSPCEELVAAAKGVDVLIHEVYHAASLVPEKRPGGEHWPQYMHEFHTSDVELGRLASRIQPKLLILYHIVGPGGTVENLLAGIREGGFTGRVVVGADLDQF